MELEDDDELELATAELEELDGDDELEELGGDEELEELDGDELELDVEELDGGGSQGLVGGPEQESVR